MENIERRGRVKWSTSGQLSVISQEKIPTWWKDNGNESNISPSLDVRINWRKKFFPRLARFDQKPVDDKLQTG